MPAKPSISLCLITKDEASFIENCIKSVSDVVDQIIVVDTGSTDNTRELARACGAEVHNFPWNDSYADARNASLEHARCDWILMLDADGELDEASKRLVLELVARRDRSATYVGKARSYFSNGEVADSMFRMLWPNHQDYRFRNRVHEQLVDAQGSSDFKTVSVDLVMHHFGYLKEVWEAKQKGERYRRLLELELESRPDDFMTRVHSASHYLNIQEFDKALEHYGWCAAQLEAGKVPGPLAGEWTALILGNMCGAQVQLGRFAEAVAAGERAVKAHHGVSVAWYWLGLARARTGDLDGGIDAIQSARKLGDGASQTLLFANQSMAGWLAEQALGEMYYLKGDYPAAMRHLDREIKLNPTSAEGWLLAAMASAAAGDFDAALERFGVGTSLSEPGERAAQAYAMLRRVAERLDPVEIVLRSLQSAWMENLSVRRWLLEVLEARLAIAESTGLHEDGRTSEARATVSHVAGNWPALGEARELLDRLDRGGFDQARL